MSATYRNENESILYSKEDIVLRKHNKTYNLIFNVKNQHIFIQKIIDFNFVKLIYDLNSDIYERVSLHKLNENQATILILMKDLFDDLGIPQQYIYGNLYRYDDNQNNISFTLNTIKERNIPDIPDEAEQKLIENIKYNCIHITPHESQFNIQFELFHMIPIVEKMITTIIIKMFKRVKQFIENVRV
jgi:hypothetical protein